MENDQSQKYDELIENLRGIRHVAIVTSYDTGFALTNRAISAYLDRVGTNYTLEQQPDREAQLKYGDRVIVNGMEICGEDIPRDDPELIWVLRDMGKDALFGSTTVAIVKIPADIHWHIAQNSRGREWVAEDHRTWWN